MALHVLKLGLLENPGLHHYALLTQLNFISFFLSLFRRTSGNIAVSQYN